MLASKSDQKSMSTSKGRCCKKIEKLNRQYAGRLPQAHLVPLVAESGGRWHPEAESLLRQLARAYVRRAAGL